MVKETMFYNLLGVKPGSSDSDLKKAYRKLALQYNLDKNSSPEVGKKFKDLLMAYGVVQPGETENL